MTIRHQPVCFIITHRHYSQHDQYYDDIIDHVFLSKTEAEKWLESVTYDGRSDYRIEEHPIKDCDANYTEYLDDEEDDDRYIMPEDDLPF
jgi:hypothetical protein